LAAQSRVDTPEGARRPFYLYVDEFQNFVTSSFDKVLTEARAFRLGLVCANQFPEQLSRELQQSISANVATTVQCVRTRQDYGLQVRSLEEAGLLHEITPVPPPSNGSALAAEQIRQLSRSRYGRDVQAVEASIVRRLGSGQPATRLRVVNGWMDVDED